MINENSVIKLTSVLDLSWEHGDDYVKGRPHAALSLRIVGHSVITGGEKTEHLSSGDIIYVPK